MRRHDEPIDVRRGLVAGQEAPEQFIWRGTLWVVRDVVSHWVETGAWWEQSKVAALLGIGAAGSSPTADPVSSAADPVSSVAAASLGDVLRERDVWRVEASRGRFAWRRSGGDNDESTSGYGVFDLAFDWSGGVWHLVRSID